MHNNITWELSKKDRLTAIKARLGINRMEYRENPGLYPLGTPGPDSPILVTANYTFSFNALRSSLKNISAWILLLDTGGVNVWCAAGKGTFSTKELIKRIRESGLFDLVLTRDIILPQLGAPGIRAETVERETGFRIHYGPVRAEDLKEYLAGGYKKTPDMAKVRFPLKDRAVLVPLELLSTPKPMAAGLITAFVLALVVGGPFWKNFSVFILLFSGSILAGSAGVPLLLPFLPFRPLSLKGLTLGFAYGLVLSLTAELRPLSILSFSLISGGISGCLGLLFTGATTYTSQSGTLKEIKYFLPAILISFLTGLTLLTILCIKDAL